MTERYSENMKQKIALFVADSNGCYPVPASKGGAVSTLVELLVEGNNQKQLVDMSVVTYFDEKAFELSKKYPNIHFVWIRIPAVVKFLDKVVYSVMAKCTKIKATSFKSLLALGYYTFKSSRLIKKGSFNSIVLEHNIPMVWMIKLSGYQGKYFHHLHNLPRTNAKCKGALGKCSKFLCISQYMMNYIMGKECAIGPVSSDKAKILFNCIDTSKFKPIDKSELSLTMNQFGIAQNAHVLIFAGRLTWEKGIDKIMEAFNYLKTEDVELLIVGGDLKSSVDRTPYMTKLLDMAERHRGKIHFTGYIEHDKLPELYNLADIAVLPSMWEEPAGLTMVEAMACGTPVITTQSGGIPEYVGEAGIVLERNDKLPENIAYAIDTLLKDHTLYQTLRERGIERVRANFDSKNYINNFCEAINVF